MKIDRDLDEKDSCWSNIEIRPFAEDADKAVNVERRQDSRAFGEKARRIFRTFPAGFFICCKSRKCSDPSFPEMKWKYRSFNVTDACSPLQSFSNIFDLLVFLGQDFLHVAVGCSLLELPVQLLHNKHIETCEQRLNVPALKTGQRNKYLISAYLVKGTFYRWCLSGSPPVSTSWDMNLTSLSFKKLIIRIVCVWFDHIELTQWPTNQQTHNKLS